MIERIAFEDQIIAIIVRSGFHGEGVEFFTPDDFSQQLGYLSHPKGTRITPHRHNMVHRQVSQTQEVLFIRKGKVRLDLFNDTEHYVGSRFLEAGDVVLLASGGHGFEVLADLEMFEVKQGPYIGDADKTHFRGPTESDQFS